LQIRQNPTNSCLLNPTFPIGCFPHLIPHNANNRMQRQEYQRCTYQISDAGEERAVAESHEGEVAGEGRAAVAEGKPPVEGKETEEGALEHGEEAFDETGN